MYIVKLNVVKIKLRLIQLTRTIGDDQSAASIFIQRINIALKFITQLKLKIATQPLDLQLS